MVIFRVAGAFPFLASSLLMCAAVVCEPSPAFAQTSESPGELRQDTEPGSSTPRSPEQAQENKQQPHAQDAAIEAGCRIRRVSHQTSTQESRIAHRVKTGP